MAPFSFQFGCWNGSVPYVNLVSDAGAQSARRPDFVFSDSFLGTDTAECYLRTVPRY